MKSYLFIFLAILTSFTTMARDFEYTYEGQNINYTVIDEEAKTCKTKDGWRTAGNDVSGSLVLPSNPKDGNIEYTLVAIGNNSFENCIGLKSVVIPNSVLTVGEFAFSGCSNLSTATIGNSVQIIGDDAFYRSGLTSIEIPNSVETIGGSAFSYCDKLTTAVLSNSLQTISKSVFYNCSNLLSIEIPNSVQTIDDDAFKDCSSLTSIEIPNSVKTIGLRVFSYCSNLSSAIIGNSVQTIGEGAFSDCCSLTSIEIPNSVQSIGMSAFMSCSNLTSVIIGNSVKFIDGMAFALCPRLVSIQYMTNSPAEARDNIFAYSVYDTAELIISQGTKEIFSSTWPWCLFANITEKEIGGTDEIICDTDSDDIDYNVSYDVYNLNGTKINNSLNHLGQGIYIIRQGNNVKKITIN